MTLTETGQSRVRGYLFILERSLRTFLPPAVVADAVREVETHILERVDQMPDGTDERAMLERVLNELGPPLRVAQAYSMEMTVDEAIVTGRIGAIARGLWNIAASTIGGFAAALGLFTGYAFGIAFIAIAVLKPIFPDNVGFVYENGVLKGFGHHVHLGPTAEVRGGYWIIPVCLALGVALLIGTHAVARRLLGWWKKRLAERREERMLVRTAMRQR
jgi:hypothetical protein